MIEQLLVATTSGDIDSVMQLLAPDVVHLGDGGADRRAARRPVVGPERVARLLTNLAQRLVPLGYSARLATVNGGTGVVFEHEGHVDSVMSLSLAADGRVRRVYIQRNPDKLEHVT